MAFVELFGKDYNIKDFICGITPDSSIPRKPSVILYVRIHNDCNGNCKFCLNFQNTNDSKLDLNKLKFIEKYLTEKEILATVTITGGEPMLNPKYLNDVINALVEVRPNIQISISTNGTNLEEILKFDNLKNIQYIHISRHHYIDEVNEQILGTKTVSSEKIKLVQNALNNIIINTVLSKDNICSTQDVKNMCEYALHLNVNRLHLVSLIDYNEYCRTNYVDLNKLLKQAEDEKILKKHCSRYRQNYCECHFYSYKGMKLDDFTIMSRLTHQNYCNYVEQLVYTNDNKLLTGFDSKTIIYK